ncbi:imelysin family protein [Aquabacter spiritensis]|uniref:Putative iron-regulated protein n=1 Tax=Aquabacter spiritensis TaxID=933073 RepID=A0A4V2UYJ7_9HYPH|nr:imelysin family protein [Aquabacter spiritensis]TCT07668.1 putative iron-regulated protein [Aquabacter spiritensis]
MRAPIAAAVFAIAFGLAAPAVAQSGGAPTAKPAAAAPSSQAAAPKPRAVIVHYADMAQAMYTNSYLAAKEMQTAISAFLAAPSAETHKAAQAAWRKARDPYQITEAFRFGNPVVDDWEGNVNAWPLDEGLIDYVDTKTYGTSSDENPLYTANIIASKSLRIGKKTIDLTKITPALLHQLNSAAGVEANVASGWHAIEFLLWGKDLHGTERGMGERPWTDYDRGAGCTHGNCARRGDYLRVATDTLVADLKEMADDWGPKGKARVALLKKKDKPALAVIFTGIGSLSYGELAGERMKLGLLLHDPEEEHDCFSDNTHNSHYYDEVGIQDVYYGRFTKIDGTTMSGPSVADLVRATDPKIADEIDAKMAAALAALKVIKDSADSGDMYYDMMLAEGNEKGNKMIQDGVDALVAQAHAIERGVAALKIQIKVEGSDSLDNPDAAKKK